MKWFKDLRMFSKLIIGFIVMASVSIIIGVVGVMNIQKIQRVDNLLLTQNMGGMGYTGDAFANFNALQLSLMQYSTAENDEVKESYRKVIEEHMAKVEECITAYATRVNQDNQKIVTQYKENVSNWNAYKDKMQQELALIEKGEIDKVREFAKSKEKIVNTLNTGFSSLMMLNYEDALARSASNAKVSKSSAAIVYIICAIGTILSIFLGFLISRLITKAIRKMVVCADQIALGNVNTQINVVAKDEIGQLASALRRVIENIRIQAHAVERIADGDLTVEVEVRSKDDLLGRKLSELVQKNNEVLSNIVSVADQVTIGARQLSTASITLSEGANEQASSIEELTASLEEISAQTELNAENANQANDLAENAKAKAIQGNDEMKRMLRAMKEINESSANISKIIKAIDDIAFQTNILALNAAVEAARAGQHGKGFAVVAEEVRTLAARSANAAKETTDMIEGSIKKSEDGTKIANNTAQSLDAIVNEVERVATLISDIATASNEQATAIGQVNQGIIQVSQVVQENSATSEESASASEQLSSQAEVMREAINQFKLKQNINSSKNCDDVILNKQKTFPKISNPGAASQMGTQPSKKKIVLCDNEFGKY